MRSDLAKPDRPAIIRRVLVVDDDEQMLKVFSRAFNRMNIPGFAVTVIDPGLPIDEQVLASASGFDLILMDGQMPGTYGPVLVEELRASGYQGYIAANSSDPQSVKRMLANGADFVINNKDAYNLKDHFQR